MSALATLSFLLHHTTLVIQKRGPLGSWLGTIEAAARSSSAARSALPASEIAADNFERKTILETAMLADLTKSAVAADSSVRTSSTIVSGIFCNFYS